MHFMPDCKEVTRMVSESLDRPLPFSRRVWMRMHLMMCRYCSRFKRQMQVLQDLARLPPATENGGHPPAGLSPEARERIKSVLSEEEKRAE